MPESSITGGSLQQNQVCPDVQGTLPTSPAESGPRRLEGAQGMLGDPRYIWSDINHAADDDWDQAANIKRASEWQLPPVTDSPAETRDSGRHGEDPRKEAGDPAQSGRSTEATLGSWEVLYQSSELVPTRKSLSGSDGCQVKSSAH